MRLTIIASLPLASVALAHQLSFDVVRFPDVISSNRTCSIKDEDGWPPSPWGFPPVCPPTPGSVSTKTAVVPPPEFVEPWTEAPSCIQTFDGPHIFCIYTSSTFARGRGISLFTTPSVARHIAENSAFLDGTALKGVNDISNPPYIAQPLPGRGIGLIMNRTLQRGDNIFSHTPVLIVHRAAFELFMEADRFPFQRDAVERLPERSRDLFLSLHGHFGGDNVDDIIHTNSFQVSLGEEEEAHNIVLPETSRINHDCRPNAHYYFDTKTLTHHVHAVRTIHPGEELTISYTDGGALRAERQAAIKSSWGFECSCSLCSQRETFTQESDKRLQLIAALEERLDDWSHESPATPEMAETFISLFEQERLHAPVAIAYTHAALAHNAVGNAYTALKYATLAVEFGTLNSGPDDPDVQVMREVMEDPRKHWSWKIRMRV